MLVDLKKLKTGEAKTAKAKPMLQSSSEAKKPGQARMLTTANTSRERVELEPEPLKRGPSTSDPSDPANIGPRLTGGFTSFGYLSVYATKEELDKFAAIVRARVSREPTHVWEKCNRCGDVFARRFRDKAGRPCFVCNRANYADGGFMMPMTPKEVKAHLEAQAKAEAEARQRDLRAELEATNTDRKKHGLIPWTVAEFNQYKAKEAAGRREDLRRSLARAEKKTGSQAPGLTGGPES